MDATMTEPETEDAAEVFDCELCGRETPLDDLDDDTLCPECSAAAKARAEAEEAYQDAVSVHEDCESTVESLEQELAELLAEVKAKRREIADARDQVKDAANDVTKCGTLLEAAEAALDARTK
jgi:septal ring factor EnvC (AmiA/AmiB activator)